MFTPRATINGLPADTAALLRFVRSGYGHFSTMQLRHAGVRGLSLHLARLQYATQLLFDVPLDIESVRGYLRQTVHGLSEASLRVSVAAANFSARAMPDPAQLEVLVQVDAPAAELLAAVRLMSLRHAHYLPQIKHTGNLALLHLRRQARMQGFDDALLLTAEGHIAEGPTFNIGFISGNTLLWPQAPRLDGITLQLLSRAWEQEGGQLHHAPLCLADVLHLDGAFCCNSGGIWPVCSIDDQSLPDSAIRVAHLRQLLAGLPVEPI